MKIWTERGLSEKTVTRMLPENEQDVETLSKLADDRESLGDGPKMTPPHSEI